jgi:hypothetical protein
LFPPRFRYLTRFFQSRKAPIAFYISVHLSVRLPEFISVAQSGRIAMKFDFGYCLENLSIKPDSVKIVQTIGQFTQRPKEVSLLLAT